LFLRAANSFSMSLVQTN